MHADESKEEVAELTQKLKALQEAKDASDATLQSELEALRAEQRDTACQAPLQGSSIITLTLIAGASTLTGASPSAPSAAAPCNTADDQYPAGCTWLRQPFGLAALGEGR